MSPVPRHAAVANLLLVESGCNFRASSRAVRPPLLGHHLSSRRTCAATSSPGIPSSAAASPSTTAERWDSAGHSSRIATPTSNHALRTIVKASCYYSVLLRPQLVELLQQTHRKRSSFFGCIRVIYTPLPFLANETRKTRALQEPSYKLTKKSLGSVSLVALDCGDHGASWSLRSGPREHSENNLPDSAADFSGDV